MRRGRWRTSLRSRARASSTTCRWHRVVADFVVQGGDPRGDGEGGPGYTIRDEINQRPYLRGTVGMALDWADTGGSQFFITHSPQPHLDGRYTVFGQVVAGMDVVDAMQQWDTGPQHPRVGRGELDRRRRALSGASARQKKGDADASPFFRSSGRSLTLLRLLGLLGRLLCLLRHRSYPPLQVGLCVKVSPRHLR